MAQLSGLRFICNIACIPGDGCDLYIRFRGGEGRVSMTSSRIILHLPERFHGPLRRKDHIIYPKIEDIIRARGGRVEIARRVGAAARPADQDLHIVDNGHIQRAGYLNAATAYFDTFWHMDPSGVLANSSISDKIFEPELIDKAAADRFYASIIARFAAVRRSRYRQPDAVLAVPDEAIAVFLQGPAPHQLGQAHCSSEEMLCAVAKGADGRAVVVKPHPLKPDLGLAQISRVRAQGHALMTTTANVHDVLAKAAVSVSINSAVAMEGFQHGKPAIVFGKSDFHHFVETVRNGDDFGAALQTALASKLDYARALYWYFGLNCLWLEAPDFEARLLAVFAEAGFDAARLGLTR